MKKLKTLLTLAVLSLGFSRLTLQKETLKTEAVVFTDEYVRIAAKVLIWWIEPNTIQPLVIADDTYFKENVIEILPREIVSDEGQHLDPGYLFYDVKHSEMSGKYVGLAQRSINGEVGSYSSKTIAQEFNEKHLHTIWRMTDGFGLRFITLDDDDNDEGRHVSNTFVAHMLCGYLTCSDSNINGYMAYGTLDANFDFEKRTQVDDVTVYDFASKDHYGSGRYGEKGDESGGNLEVKLGEKITAMKLAYEKTISEQSQLITNTPSMDTPIIIGILGITTITGYYLLSRKKKVM